MKDILRISCVCLSAALLFALPFALPHAVAANSAMSDETQALIAKAIAGDFDAQYRVGAAFDNGSGAPRDAVEAARWYRLAADGGHAEAQNALGTVMQGDKRYAEARGWYEKASKQGHALATHNLAFLYDTGLGVPANAKQALALYERAADKGLAESMWNMANIHGSGQLGKADMQAACIWTLRAQKYVGWHEQDLQEHLSRAVPYLEKALPPAGLAECRGKVDQWKPASR